MKVEDFTNIIREIIREEEQGLITEWDRNNPDDDPTDWEEYRRDQRRQQQAAAAAWDAYRRDQARMDAERQAAEREKNTTSQPTPPSRPMSAFDRRWQHVQRGQSAPLKGGPPQAPAPTSTADAKKAMLQQVVKYKNTDGSEGEATVASLLKYPTDHPGRKAAARIYAQFMAKTGQSRPRTEGHTTRDSHTKPADDHRKPHMNPHLAHEEICEGENCEETTHTMGTNMNAHDKLKQIVREELKNVLRELIAKSKMEDTPSVSLQNPAPSTAPAETDKELDEKSVPEPYNRNSPPRRKMSKGQVEKRDGIGKRMLKNKKMVAKFQRDHGQDWKSYLWAAASAAALRTKK